jgi:dethiobiotin synthetase
LSLAIVGTGPGVGKTVVSAALLTRYGRDLPLVYWKPVEVGAVEGRDAEVVDQLAGHCCEIAPEAYTFLEPTALHVAARMESRRIDSRRLRFDYETGRRDGRQWIVDTVGGLLTPLSDAGPLFGDLLVELALPCLVVAPSALDTLNHTLLTLESLRARGLEPAGVVLNGPPSPESRRAVETFGEIEVIAELPPLEPLDRKALERVAEEIDPEGLLEKSLSPEIRG